MPTSPQPWRGGSPGRSHDSATESSTKAVMPRCRMRLNAVAINRSTLANEELHEDLPEHVDAEQNLPVQLAETQAREVAFPMVPTSIATATEDEKVGHGHGRHRHQKCDKQCGQEPRNQAGAPPHNCMTQNLSQNGWRAVVLWGVRRCNREIPLPHFGLGNRWEPREVPPFRCIV